MFMMFHVHIHNPELSILNTCPSSVAALVYTVRTRCIRGLLRIAQFASGEIGSMSFFTKLPLDCLYCAICQTVSSIMNVIFTILKQHILGKK